MNLTNDEIIDMIDCVNSRLDDLTECHWRIGPDNLDDIEDEIGRLNSLMTKLNESLEA